MNEDEIRIPFKWVGARCVKMIASAAGDVCVFILERDDGLHSFQARERKRAGAGYEYWAVPTYCSGLYQTAEAAEQAARRDIPWLKAQNSN